MTEELIWQLIPGRISELGYHNYHVRYRDLSIKESSSEEIKAYNELWFIVGDPQGLVVESAYGLFDSTGEYVFDNVHQHRGEITITNPDAEVKRIKFIQLIIIN
jgi:hypothetical protein